MGFIDSYKRLEKLCNEIYGENHGVKVYIDDMINNPIGSRYVQGWNEDLKKLRHYNWVRNKIVHEPGCTEDNMCEPYDAQWIENFHSRILSTNDPLAVYRRIMNQMSAQTKNYSEDLSDYIYSGKRSSKKSAGCVTYVIGVLIVAILLVLTMNTI